MRWQRIAQLAIAVFVLGFIALIVVSMKRRAAVPTQAEKPVQQAPPGSLMHNPGECKYEHLAGGRKVFEIQCGSHTVFEGGRMVFKDKVRILTHRNDKDLIINANQADVQLKNDLLEKAVFTGDVWLTTAGGVDVKSDEATYTEADGMVTIPRAVAFRKGRMNGSGVGATYDRNREVLWILDKAQIKVAPKDGQGGLEGEAAAAGMARQEHYLRLTKDAVVRGEGRTMQADEIIITLTEDDERVQMTQLRGNSRISGGAGGPQSMTAQDIDLMYAEDGRTLQNANLMQGAVVQLAHSTGSGQAGAGRKRIAGNVINIALAPDGSTVTNLTATENVQVDLPAEPKVPAKRIRSAALIANGAPDTGLRAATFTGNVEYKETQAAARNVPAIDRTARSQSLVIETKPGLGAIEKAEFRGEVSFDEAPDLHGEGPHAIYEIDKGRLEIFSTDSYPGKPPRVTDGKISVNARTVAVTLGGRELTADTKVKSLILAKQDRGRGQQQSRVPSMLKQDAPVNVTANRLHYLGSTSKGTYSGNVTMWQDDDDGGSNLKGDTLVVEDKTGNLELTGNAITNFMLEETDKKTGRKKKTLTIGKGDTFTYDDARRVATYTGNAQLDGAQGNLTAAQIQVTLKPNTNEIEKLEAWAKGGIVKVTESVRTVTGTHLTYTGATDTYLMVGTPVIVYEEEGTSCREGRGTSLEFHRGAEAGNWKLAGPQNAQGETNTVACRGAKR
jgi:lipopolysaccharide export system protein LptA